MEGELEFASVSLRTLYREFMPSVYRMAFSYMQNHPDSEDVVQECFLRLAQSGKHFQDRRQVQAWLIAITTIRKIIIFFSIPLPPTELLQLPDFIAYHEPLK